MRVTHYQNPPVCGAEFNPLTTYTQADVTCCNCVSMHSQQLEYASRKAIRTAALDAVREEIRCYIDADLAYMAIEEFRHSHFSLLVEFGLCEYADEPEDEPLAAERTEAFFSTYFG